MGCRSSSGWTLGYLVKGKLASLTLFYQLLHDQEHLDCQKLLNQRTPVNSFTISLHVRALFEIHVEGEGPGRAIKLIVPNKNWFDCLGRFLAMIMQHGGKDTMRNMSIYDVMKHGVENSVVAIHCGKSSPNPVPFCVFVMRQRRMRMLQKCDEDKKTVDNQERYTIHFE